MLKQCQPPTCRWHRDMTSLGSPREVAHFSRFYKKGQGVYVWEHM
jgi:hypothetical protein